MPVPVPARRLEVLDSLGYVVACTPHSRVVLAGCRLTAVLAQHLHPGNEEVVVESRLIPALVRSQHSTAQHVLTYHRPRHRTMDAIRLLPWPRA